MKRQDYYDLVNNWNKFLIQENTEFLDINTQIQRAINLILEESDQKLKIMITKEGNEFALIAELVDSNTGELLDKVAYILFRKFPYSRVTDQEGIKRVCYVIEHTEFVEYNLGPLMYDIIIEFVSNDESLLCPDRFEIKEKAQNLWRNYFNRRDDVKFAQLDIENDNLDPKEYPNLTPQFEDDFYQTMSIADMGKEWFNSPFSKGYYKLNSHVIEFIKNNDLFIYKEIL